MNNVTATGWLLKDAWLTMQPGSGQRFLCWDLMVAGRLGEDATPWRCELEDLPDGKAMLYHHKLVPGAAVIVQAELAARVFSKHGVREGYSRYLKVHRLEFSRLPVGGQETEERETPEKNARPACAETSAGTEGDKAA